MVDGKRRKVKRTGRKDDKKNSSKAEIVLAVITFILAVITCAAGFL